MAGGESGSETRARARSVVSQTRATPVVSVTRARLLVGGGDVDNGVSMA